MNYMSFIEKQWKAIAFVFLAAVVAGSGFSFVTYQKVKKEQNAQESYFLTEKKFLDLKNKKNNPEDATKDMKDLKKDEPADYASVKIDFEKVITNYPQSKAAQMASLYLADIFVAEKNRDQALATLQKVSNGDTGLISTLVQQQIGQILADKDKCQEAIQIWQKIINSKESDFIHNEVKIQQALCYQKLNDLKKAEEILTNLANQKSENGLEASATSKEAEKYLRLIQFKKTSGT